MEINKSLFQTYVAKPTLVRALKFDGTSDQMMALKASFPNEVQIVQNLLSMAPVPEIRVLVQGMWIGVDKGDMLIRTKQYGLTVMTEEAFRRYYQMSEDVEVLEPVETPFIRGLVEDAKVQEAQQAVEAGVEQTPEPPPEEPLTFTALLQESSEFAWEPDLLDSESIIHVQSTQGGDNKPVTFRLITLNPGDLEPIRGLSYAGGPALTKSQFLAIMNKGDADACTGV